MCMSSILVILMRAKRAEDLLFCAGRKSRSSALRFAKGIRMTALTSVARRDPVVVLALELVQHVVGEHFVRDGRDLFGVLPCRVQRLQLAHQRAALDVFVCRHLECEAVHRWKSEERRL